MDLEQAVVETLQGVTALGGRVYPAEALKNAGAPFAFWLVSSDREEQCLDGYAGLRTGTIEVHVVADRYLELRTVALAVRGALIAMQGQTFSVSGSDTGVLVSRVDLEQASPDLHETEVEMFRRVYSIDFYWQEVAINETGGQSSEPEGSGGEVTD